MDILVIDDLRKFTGFEAIYARTLDEGRRLIDSQPWDQVFLDHDLGYRGNPEGNKETIRPLVLELAQRASDGDILPIGQFYACSDNPPGQDWIIGTLGRWYQIESNQPLHTIEWG